jgi:predicted NBD/HSP70 family sugar kinase
VAIALKGDAEALGMIRDSGRRVGEVLSAAVTLLNPEVVVVGGDLAGAYEPFVAGLRETVYQRSTALATRQLRIVASTFGERQGLVGCAAMINQWITSERAVDSGPVLSRPRAIPAPCYPAQCDQRRMTRLFNR